MNRRSFLAFLAAAPLVEQTEPVRRVYSFLWDNPLVKVVDPWSRITNGNVVPGLDFEKLDFETSLKAWYSAERVAMLLPRHGGLLDLLQKGGDAQ